MLFIEINSHLEVMDTEALTALTNCFAKQKEAAAAGGAFYEISQFKRLLNQPSKKKRKKRGKLFESCLNVMEKSFVVHTVRFVKTNARYIKPITYPPD